MLRLGGQALMVHTSMTATARAFPRQAGRALGISNLGMPVGEALLPLAVAVGIGAIGWRNVWWLAIACILAGTALALACRNRGEAATPEAVTPRAGTRQGHRGGRLWTDPRMLFTIPVVLAPSFITTGFFFHQGRLLEEEGWPFEWWAAWFVGYAMARAMFMALAGPVIDRFGATRVLPLFLMPQAVSMLAIILGPASWGAPLYLILTGITSGISATLMTALWNELYGSVRLAEVRATASAASVIASGVAPSAMGLLIDVGVSLTLQAAGCAVFTLLASLAAARVRVYAQVPGR